MSLDDKLIVEPFTHRMCEDPSCGLTGFKHSHKCRECGKEAYTYFVGDLICDNCWELKHRIEMDLPKTVMILESLGYKVVKI